MGVPQIETNTADSIGRAKSYEISCEELNSSHKDCKVHDTPTCIEDYNYVKNLD